MPIDRKYGRVTLERQRNVGDDEPVFIFRGKDALLGLTLRYYRNLCEDSGSPANHLRAIEAAMHDFAVWQQDNGVQVPQSVGYDGT